MWYSNGREMKLDWSSGNNQHCHSSIILHQRGIRKNRASRAWHVHTPETIVIHVCTLLSHKSRMKRDSIYLHWQRLVDLTFTWPYWNKLSCQKPVFLEQGWCNSSISLCLAANWMSFELTLNRIVTLINSQKIVVPRTDWQTLCGTINRKKYRFCIKSKVLLCRRLIWVVVSLYSYQSGLLCHLCSGWICHNSLKDEKNCAPITGCRHLVNE
jgi:hypothetical protein